MMADGNEEVMPLEEPIRDGHKAVFNFVFLGLDVRDVTSLGTGYNTRCRTMPTHWRMQLSFFRSPEDKGVYIFSIKLDRMDYSNNPVEVSLYLAFLNASGKEVIPKIGSRRDVTTYKNELERTVYNIPLHHIRAIVTVKVSLEIEKCHTDINWQCAPKFKSAEGRINKISKL